MTFGEFFRAHYARLVGGLSMVGYGLEAEEAASEAMFRLHRQWTSVHENARKSFVWTVGWRTAEKLREKRLSQGFELPDRPPTPEQIVGESQEEAEQRAWLAREIPRLPDRQREVLVRWLAGGFTDKQIAKELGITAETVRAHRRHAIATLRRRRREQTDHDDGRG